MITETYLPVFPGFYNTIFEPEYDEFLQENDVEWDQVIFDNKEYETDAAKEMCNIIKRELSSYVQNITFQNIISPKEYNFRNDSINIAVNLERSNREAISELIYDNKDEFEEFLKERYTSRHGFIPSHPNTFKEWEEKTNRFMRYDDNGHTLGALLEFVCQIEEIDQETLLEGMRSNGVYGEMYCAISEQEEE